MKGRKKERWRKYKFRLHWSFMVSWFFFQNKIFLLPYLLCVCVCVCVCTLHAHSRTLIYTSMYKHHEQYFALSFPRLVLNHLSHRWHPFLYSGSANSLHISTRCVDLCSLLLLTFVTMLMKSHLQFTFLNINTCVSQFHYTHSCLLHYDNPCDTYLFWPISSLHEKVISHTDKLVAVVAVHWCSSFLSCVWQSLSLEWEVLCRELVNHSFEDGVPVVSKTTQPSCHFHLYSCPNESHSVINGYTEP